ncbi:hypothetical protein FHR87_003308 [Azomonas macrocytogenes]|uniref:Uncharacterized protein n=1 Tax=Azomonas macrocytogenes TaxID=69962 RepID=A0A839T7P6_AZOMA|nr:hypothetical protein [Azomonas macrocytogenes]
MLHGIEACGYIAWRSGDKMVDALGRLQTCGMYLMK